MFLTQRGLLARIDTARIEAAIRAAELRTSGEIRVSVAPFFWGNVQRAAERAFERLGMTATHERNGVLLFVVPARRRLVVLGDAGIHARVGPAFWERVAQAVAQRFRAGDFTGGLEDGVTSVGAQLAEHFPHAGHQDRNELSDAVDFAPRRG
jgi:uncharacterized membrane protein